MEIGSIQSRVDAIAKAFGEKPVQQTSASSKAEVEARVNAISEFTGLKDNVKTEAKSITNINDIFGGLKKSEKAIIKIEEELGGLSTDNKAEVALKINDIVANTTYKEQPLLSKIPLKAGGFDAIEKISGYMSLDDVSGFQSTLGEIKDLIGEDLKAVKKEIMSKTNVMGSAAQSSVDNSGISMDLSSITKSTNMDYLKQQMKGLLE